MRKEIELGRNHAIKYTWDLRVGRDCGDYCGEGVMKPPCAGSLRGIEPCMKVCVKHLKHSIQKGCEYRECACVSVCVWAGVV